MKHDNTLARASMDSPLGPITLGASASGLTGVWFDGQRHGPNSEDWPLEPRQRVLKEAARQLNAYFAKRLREFDLPLDLSAGSDFQQSVWRALLTIPRGHTTSYGALAATLGKASASRAIGGAVGRNPLSIIVPCHRVIGKDGSLAGYAGGLERKVALLQLEGVLL